MTQIVFDLKDFSGAVWDSGTLPEVIARASRPAVDPWGAYAGESHGMVQTNGSVELELAPTVAMHGDVHYTLEVAWVEGGVARREFWPHQLRVPESVVPVPLTDILDVEPSGLHQLIEASKGTTIGDRPVPHSRHTDVWIKIAADGQSAALWLPEGQ